MKMSRKAPLALALALLMCTPTAANALAPGAYTEGSGTKEDPTVTITVSTAASADGSTAATTTKETQWSDVNGEGFGTSHQSTRSDTVVADSHGRPVAQTGYEQGEETTTQEQYPELELPLEPGRETTATTDLKDSVTGQLKEDNPGQYDQTATVVNQQREATATVGEPTFTTGDGNVNADVDVGLNPVQPEWTGREQDVTEPRPNRFGSAEDQGPEGYDFQYTGWGQDSHYGSYYTVADGSSEESATEEADIVQFLLTDRATPGSPDHTAYCVDLNTAVQAGWWYKLDNLETAGYYGEEAANHIRAIMAHGYMGTAAGEAGSLSRLIDTLTNAQSDGTDIDGALAGLDFSKMTEGEAMAATQIAIWTYGNRAGDNELLFSASNYDGDDWSAEEGDAEAWERINAAAKYLAQLTQGPENATQVITQDKFIEDISLTVKEKLAGGESAAYNTDLYFALVVTPGQNDSLNVQVLQDGRVVATKAILPGQREYVIEDLPFAENSDMTFTLRMEGAQYLEQGVYIYTSEVREGVSSQTLVGLAEGYNAVDLSMALPLRLEVQDAVVTTERIWRSEWSNGPTYPIHPVYPSYPGAQDPPALDIPRTGDSSILWAAFLSLAAGCAGLAAASRRGKCE